MPPVWAGSNIKKLGEVHLIVILSQMVGLVLISQSKVIDFITLDAMSFFIINVIRTYVALIIILSSVISYLRETNSELNA